MSPTLNFSIIMNDDTKDGVAEFLLKEQEIIITLEKESTATRLEYYIPTTTKGRISMFIGSLSVLALGALALRNGDEVFFVGMLTLAVLFSEIHRLERKIIALQKLHERKQ
jgi:hypothetical protein